MKAVWKVLNILITIIVLLTIIAALGSAIKKEPILFSVIRSNSMYPIWERGDMVIIQNLSDNADIEVGDIIFFNAKEGSLSNKGWIAHRVIGGNEEAGYMTKGDANEDADQKSSKDVFIQREWIAGRAFTIGEQPIVIPKLGFPSLWLEKYQSNPYVLPAVALLLAIIVGISELKSGKKRQKKKGIDLQLIYFLTGLTISIVIAATMIMSGQKMNINYEVSEGTKGVILGSSVGLLTVGEEITQPLSKMKNGGMFKLIGTITTNDEQITFNQKKAIINPDEDVEAEFTVTAKKVGKYDSFIQIGLFYPILPSSLIYFLATKSYWLALAVVSLIPGLPFMLYPLIDRKMRTAIFKVLKQTKRKVFRKLHI